MEGYPPDWDSRRRRVYKRDNYTCQNCGAGGGPHGDTELHAHHIVQKSRGGTHQTSNLITLCDECHKTVHGNQEQPSPQHPNTSEHIEYGDLADEIIRNIGDVIGLVEGNLMRTPDTGLREDASHWSSLAHELRPAILEITDAVETLSKTPASHYPDELVSHDKTLIAESMELLNMLLRYAEYSKDKAMEVTVEIYTCPDCGGTVDPKTQDFCTSCGETVQIGIECPNCEEGVLTSDDFCSSCGTALDTIKGRGIGAKTEEIGARRTDMIREISNKADEITEMVDQRNEIVHRHSGY